MTKIGVIGNETGLRDNSKLAFRAAKFEMLLEFYQGSYTHDKIKLTHVLLDFALTHSLCFLILTSSVLPGGRDTEEILGVQGGCG